MRQVILVDMNDREIGTMEKMTAHEQACLHRAFSVFLFRENKVLLQKRASSKYHCGGLWTNTCCSHPEPGENVTDAAIRRLREELDIHVDDVQEVHSFVYHHAFENGLTEFEYDHVLVGEYDGSWVENSEEVDEVKWVDINELKEDIASNPKKYTPWFIVALNAAVEGRIP